MNQFQLQAEILRNQEVAQDIFRMSLMAPEIAGAATPGQFVMLRTSQGTDPLLRRPFSINQVTSNGAFHILYKRVGKGSTLLSSIVPGTQISVVGPLGHGFRMQTKTPVCLVGGGMGIAPLYFLAKELLRQSKPPSNLVALLGARTASELAPLLLDFEELGITTLVATDDGSMGHHGFVAGLIKEQLPLDTDWMIYTCGPHPMMHSVVRLANLHGWQCQVSLETMMACGISACLGCAIPRAGLTGHYLHVCKDGPVFNAQEVAWL